MRKVVWLAGVAAATLLPSIAFAQDRCEQRSDNREAAGTVLGAVAGAVVGSNVAGRHDRTAGAVVGGVVGAVAGNAIARSTADCDRAYGYYDQYGQWHSNDRRVDNASGYFDRDGRFVEGEPNGYYAQDGRWVESQGAGGYYDRDGRWVPATVNGYYDSRGTWIAGSAPGYYDNGRWVSGPSQGYYDRDGRWVRGEAPGHRDERGVWVADAQYGYYDNGRWVRGETYGYYDQRGRWIPQSGYRGYTQGNPQGYDQPFDMWRGAGSSLREREMYLDQQIRRGASNGSLSRRETNSAMRNLADIRRMETSLRRRNGGQLGPRNTRMINDRLDQLARQIRMDRRDDDRRPDGGYRN